MRTSEITRNTNETKIKLSFTIEDGKPGKFCGSSNIGFLDHMLSAFCVHGGFTVCLEMTGDLEVDCHHSAEDLGIVLGKAFSEAVGNKNTLTRYGSSFVPMDEALSRSIVDISARPYLVFNVSFRSDKIGDLDTQMVKEFFRAFAFNGGLTLHIENLYGENDHHIAESVFKAVARSLKEASALNNGYILSSKGTI